MPTILILMVRCFYSRFLIHVILLLSIKICVVQNEQSDPVKLWNSAKRFLWLTHNRRLAFPGGTMLDFAPTLQIPASQNQTTEEIFKVGPGVNVTWHFYTFFDKLGMINEFRPWPPIYPFSDFYPYGRFPLPRPPSQTPRQPRNNGSNVSQPSRQSSKLRGNSRIRVAREIVSLPPPENVVGGERAVLVPKLEETLNSFGYDGRAILLRTVCEIHEFPLHRIGYGLLGEILTLMFSISRSDYADSHLSEYLKAEMAGKAERGGCLPYFENSSTSLFKWEKTEDN